MHAYQAAHLIHHGHRISQWTGCQWICNTVNLFLQESIDQVIIRFTAHKYSINKDTSAWRTYNYWLMIVIHVIFGTHKSYASCWEHWLWNWLWNNLLWNWTVDSRMVIWSAQAIAFRSRCNTNCASLNTLIILIRLSCIDQKLEEFLLVLLRTSKRPSHVNSLITERDCVHEQSSRTLISFSMLWIIYRYIRVCINYPVVHNCSQVPFIIMQNIWGANSL